MENKKFGFLENIVFNIPEPYSLIQNNIDNIKLLPNYNHFTYNINKFTEKEKKTLYLYLSFLCQKYLIEKMTNLLPAEIGIVWYELSNYLGIYPVISYTAIVLYNWKIDKNSCFIPLLKMTEKEEDNLSEEWFYYIQILFEYEGRYIIEILDKIDIDEYIYYNEILDILLETLKSIKQIIKRIYEKCNKEIFYKKIRPYFIGSEKMKGVKIDKLDNIELNYVGGSTAQSPLIHLIDILLGINFEEKIKNHLREQRLYMIKSHRDYLEDIENKIKIREYIINNNINNEMKIKYNQCLDILKKFRKVHYDIVKNYLFNFDESAKGTGSTYPKVFLNKIIDNMDNFYL